MLHLDRPSGHLRPPLKVAYVLKRFPRLSETFILNEVLELERQGVEVEILSLLRPPPEPLHDLMSALKARVTYLSGNADGLQVKAAGGEEGRTTVADMIGQTPLFDELMPGKSSEKSLALTMKAVTAAMLCLAGGVQHLHAHFGSDAATVALLASRLSRIPFSFTAHARDIYHTYVDPETDARMRRAKMAEASFVATVSEFNKAYLTDLAGAGSPARIERIYNGIDLERFAFAGAGGRADNEVLAVGRLIEKKGFFDLIEAHRLLAGRGVGMHTVIIGDGPLQGAIEARIATAGLVGQVELLGALPQRAVMARMRHATVMALPCIIAESGDRDGLPTVLLEALAIGLPAVSTTVAGVPEIIADGADGLLVAPGAPPALADAIAALLADANQRARFAAAGRRKAEQLFSLTANVELLRREFERSVTAAAVRTTV